MAKLLEYSHVEIRYGDSVAVNDISFVLERGEILGVVGESGGGKSSLIKAAMGLLGPDGLVTRGDIRYQGVNLPDLTERERRTFNGPELAMVFQDAGASFCPVRAVGAQLYESMREHQKIGRSDFRAKATELFRKIGLENAERVLDSYPFELSGGMRQRVGIASAMLLNPKVLLADEPTSALDVSAQKQVTEEMLFMRETFGTSIIIVTHNIGVVRAMADYALVMKDGKAVEYGETARILEHPREPYAKKLMAAAPKLRRT